MPKIFGLDGSTVRQISKLFALDGSTPRRVKKLFGNNGGTVRLLFEDFSTFTISGASNAIVSPTNEVVDFGVRDDFDAGGADVTINNTGTGDASNVGSVSGLSIDVDSSHSYSSSSYQTQTLDFSLNGSEQMVVPSGKTVRIGSTNYSAGTALSDSVTNSLVGSNPNSTLTYFRYYGAGGGQNQYQNNTSFGQAGSAYGGLNGYYFMAGVYVTNTGGSARYNRLIYKNGNFTKACTEHNNNEPYNVTHAGFGYRSPATNPRIFTVRMPATVLVTSSSTGRRARVQNGSNRAFNVTGGGLTAGGSFATGSLSAGASTDFITANSTSEAWSIQGVATKEPATFTITNADSSISVSGTFADGENATQARDRIQSVLNGDSTFQSKFNTGVDADKTIGGVAHKVVTFTSDSAENTSDFTITITANDGSNTTPYEATTTQGASESLQTTVTVVREVAGSQVSTSTAISSEADTDTAGASIASNSGADVTYDASTNKIKVQDQEATISIANAGSLASSKD